MAYTKQTWADLPSKTTPINANRLTHIEDGIFNAAQTADTAASTAGTAAANVGIVSGRVETLTERVNGLDTAVSNKVDKVAGKGLSTNDYDDTDKGKVDSLGTASTKNSTSVVTQSTDLVESGAVKDIVGWGNKNLAKLYDWTGAFDNLTFTYSHNKVVLNGGNTFDSTAPSSSGVPDDGKFLLKAGTYTIWTDNANVNVEVVAYDPVEVVGSGNPATFTLSLDRIVYIRAVAKENVTFSNTEVHIQLEKGSTATAYEPYHASVEESKADNSVIGTVEDGTTVSQAYAVGSHAIRNGAFITWKNAKAQGETINDVSDYTSGDVADNLVYKAGDSIVISNDENIQIPFDGYLTTSGSSIYVFIKLNKPLVNVNSVSFSASSKITVRGISGYILNVSLLTSFVISTRYVNSFGVLVEIKKTNSTPFDVNLNNTAVNITLSDCTITLS